MFEVALAAIRMPAVASAEAQAFERFEKVEAGMMKELYLSYSILGYPEFNN